MNKARISKYFSLSAKKQQYNNEARAVSKKMGFF